MSFALLNPNISAMRPGLPGRERLFLRQLHEPLFSNKEIPDIDRKLGVICDRYRTLNTYARQEVLHPHIIPVLLGVKDAYLVYEGNPVPDALREEFLSDPEAYRGFDLLIGDNGIINMGKFRDRLRSEGEFLVANGCMRRGWMEALRDGPANDEWKAVFSSAFGNNQEEDAKGMAFNGFLMGYSLEDISWVVSLRQRFALHTANCIVSLYGQALTPRHHERPNTVLSRWEKATGYGYGRLCGMPGFWDDLDAGLYDSIEIWFNQS